MASSFALRIGATAYAEHQWVSIKKQYGSFLSESLEGSVQNSRQDRTRERRNLLIVLLMTGTFTVMEVIGGLLTQSLALLADAAIC